MPSLLPSSWLRSFGALMLPATLVSAMIATPSQTAQGQAPAVRALTVRADFTEASSQTGVITARGNVQIYYPARQIQATAAQAQYFSRERRMVLNGNVYILQQGNSIRGESVTYLIDEGRFIATPKAESQVESIYIVTEPTSTPSPAAPALPPLNLSPSPTPSSEPPPAQ